MCALAKEVCLLSVKHNFHLISFISKMRSGGQFGKGLLFTQEFSSVLIRFHSRLWCVAHLVEWVAFGLVCWTVVPHCFHPIQTYKNFSQLVDNLLCLLAKDVSDNYHNCSQYFHVLNSYVQLVSNTQLPDNSLLVCVGSTVVLNMNYSILDLEYNSGFVT